MKKPVIDDMLCIHCGMCCATCPEVFSQENNPTDVPEIKEMDDYSEVEEKVEQAIQFCPAGAISWEEEK